MSRDIFTKSKAKRGAIIWLVGINMPGKRGKGLSRRNGGYRIPDRTAVMKIDNWEDLAAAKEKFLKETREFEEQVKLARAELDERNKEIDLKNRAMDRRFQELREIAEIADYEDRLKRWEVELGRQEADLRERRRRFEKALGKVRIEEEINRSFKEEERVRDDLRRRELETGMNDIENARDRIVEWSEDLGRKEMFLMKWEARLSGRERDIEQREKRMKLAENVITLLRQNRRLYEKRIAGGKE